MRSFLSVQWMTFWRHAFAYKISHLAAQGAKTPKKSPECHPFSSSRWASNLQKDLVKPPRSGTGLVPPVPHHRCLQGAGLLAGSGRSLWCWCCLAFGVLALAGAWGLVVVLCFGWTPSPGPGFAWAWLWFWFPCLVCRDPRQQKRRPMGAPCSAFWSWFGSVHTIRLRASSRL